MLELTQGEFQALTSFVLVNYGLDLTNKKVFVELRIQRLMMESGFDSFASYFAHVCGDLSGISVSNMISGLTVNYTLFYRESYHFEYLVSHVLPYVYGEALDSRDFRIWSAGCSTGEEPYTLAMVVSEFLGPQKKAWDMSILATDISTFALKRAIQGVYQAGSVEGLNPLWVKKYIVPNPGDPGTIQIAHTLRGEVIFRQHNLAKDPFLFKKKFQIIFCRNVMIYFDEETKKQVLRKFYEHLEEGGFLFIGMSETIDCVASRFEYVMPSVYRKGRG